MNNTPETDEAQFGTGRVSVGFARKLERERDEAIMKYATEATDHMLAVNKLANERDEARFLLKAAQSALDAIHLEVGGWIKTMKENTD
jgi:hypothetical protein